jgi:hypothetical protein
VTQELLYVLGGGGVALAVAIAGWALASRRSTGQRQASALDSDLPLSLKPLLSEAQATFYNLLRLAVEDRYLVFVHVPLWCVVNVPLPERGARRPWLSQLALKRATFVLVHPGTRLAEKVVEWKEENETEPSGERADSLLETVLKSAGVQLITIHAGDVHTTADLVRLFDLGEGD